MAPSTSALVSGGTYEFRTRGLDTPTQQGLFLKGSLFGDGLFVNEPTDKGHFVPLDQIADIHTQPVETKYLALHPEERHY